MRTTAGASSPAHSFRPLAIRRTFVFYVPLLRPATIGRAFEFACHTRAADRRDRRSDRHVSGRAASHTSARYPDTRTMYAPHRSDTAYASARIGNGTWQGAHTSVNIVKRSNGNVPDQLTTS
jgi:hypothetical protein